MRSRNRLILGSDPLEKQYYTTCYMNMKSTAINIVRLVAIFVCAFSQGAYAQDKPLVIREISEGAYRWRCTVDDSAVSFYSAIDREKAFGKFSGSSLRLMTSENLDDLSPLLKKFVEWDKIARDNDLKPFYKVIAVGSLKCNFYYRPGGLSHLNGNVYLKDVPVFEKFLEQLPEMFRELEQKKAKDVNNLFK